MASVVESRSEYHQTAAPIRASSSAKIGETIRSRRSPSELEVFVGDEVLDIAYLSLIISFARDSIVQQPRYLPLRSVTTAMPTEDCSITVSASCRVSSG